MRRWQHPHAPPHPPSPRTRHRAGAPSAALQAQPTRPERESPLNSDVLFLCTFLSPGRFRLSDLLLLSCSVSRGWSSTSGRGNSGAAASASALVFLLRLTNVHDIIRGLFRLDLDFNLRVLVCGLPGLLDVRLGRVLLALMLRCALGCTLSPSSGCCTFEVTFGRLLSNSCAERGRQGLERMGLDERSRARSGLEQRTSLCSQPVQCMDCSGRTRLSEEQSC